MIPPVRYPRMVKLSDERVSAAARAINNETERWMRKAIERGPGWNVWRGPVRVVDRDPLYERNGLFDGSMTLRYEFMLIREGMGSFADGVLYKQPDLTDGERARVLAGRHDWREAEWEDHCGVPDCGHGCCEVYRGERAPTKL